MVCPIMRPRPATPSAPLADRHFVISDTRPRLRSGRDVAPTGLPDAWELPAPTGRRPGEEESDEIIVGGTRVPLRRKPRLPRPTLTESEAAGESVTLGRVPHDTQSSTLSSLVLDQLRTYGSLLEFASGANRHDSLVFHDGLHAWTTQRHLATQRSCFALEHDTLPPTSVVQRVVERCASALLELAHRLRSRLTRERLLIDVTHAHEVDDACLGWLSQQPGRSLAERAGPRQRVLAIARRHTWDTYENRVLKLFLTMAAVACAEYTGSRQALRLRDDPRVRRVERFRRHALSLLAREEIKDLPEPASTNQPNYALQFDPHYSAIWDGFRMLRSARLRDELLWQWRHRTFGELVLIDLLAALDIHSADPPESSPVAEIGLRTDPSDGHWIHLPLAPCGRRWIVDGVPAVIHLSTPLHSREPTSLDLPLVDVVIVVRHRRSTRPFHIPLVAVADSLPRPEVAPSKEPHLVILPEDVPLLAHDAPAISSALDTGLIGWPLDLHARLDRAYQLLCAVVRLARRHD